MRAVRIARNRLGYRYFRAALKRFHRRREIRGHFQHVVGLAAAARLSAPVGEGVTLSLVAPVYNARPRHLTDLLNSFRIQNAPGTELIFSDDGSTSRATIAWLDAHSQDEGVVVLRAERNVGIAAATNAGINRARGVWVGLIDHDDALAPHALAMIGAALTQAPHCQFLYTDEVIADATLRPNEYFLKPAFDRVLLSGVNYINHLSFYRSDRLRAINGLRDGFQGSQDHDLLLRYTKGLNRDEILHLPYPAYLWRRSGESYSAQFMDDAVKNARKALSQHYGADAEPMPIGPALDKNLHRVRFDLARKTWPLVSIIIPSRDSFLLISRLLAGLTQGTDYPHMEVIIIDNGSTDSEVIALYDQYMRCNGNFQVHMNPEPFNFSRAVNCGIAKARGDAILILNNDIEVLEPQWLREMVACFDFANTGIVGAKLLYPDRKIQHAGVIVGLGGLAGHWHIGCAEDVPGSMGRLWVRQSLSAVTGACLLLSRACAEAVGSFDEEVFPIAYNDVDYCLRALALGFTIIWTPFACLIHHESASRGSDETPENIARFNRDKESLRSRHRTDILEDRAYNPWYSKHDSVPDVIFLSKLPAPR